MDIQGYILCFTTFLICVGTVLCANDNFSCHVCRSDKQPTCKDAFGGNDNRFLQECDNSNKNITVYCKKEVNQVYAGHDKLIIRSCSYAEGYKPEEEVDAYRTTYWSCFTHGCNGQGVNKPLLVVIALIGCVTSFFINI